MHACQWVKANSNVPICLNGILVFPGRLPQLVSEDLVKSIFVMLVCYTRIHAPGTRCKRGL